LTGSNQEFFSTATVGLNTRCPLLSFNYSIYCLRKFVCINDNLDPLKEKENSYVEAILQDFYESILPETSKFELPLMYRNRFLTVEELRVWMQYRHFVMCAIVVCIITLIVLTCVALNGEVAHVVKFIVH
jgi:Stealth protein CR4, conserved region 4